MSEVRVGAVLHGYCQGFFSRDGLGPKRIEAIGHDWVVVRGDSGWPNFATTPNPNEDIMEYLEQWSEEQPQ